MDDRRTTVLYVFAALSAVGLALSAISHVASLFGSAGPLGDRAMTLTFGVFVVWIPAIVAARRLTKGSTRS